MKKPFDRNSWSLKNLYQESRDWIKRQYSLTENAFTTASPFGQLINIFEEWTKLVWIYIEDIAVENNPFTARKRRSIWGLSRLTGHNPTRSISAQGTVLLSIKPGAEFPEGTSHVIIPDKTELVCVSNNRTYHLRIPNATGGLKIGVGSTEKLPVKIFQGVCETQKWYATGGDLQTYSLPSKGDIENDLIEVLVNGTPYEIVESLYDMPKNSNTCMVKTGFSGGVDVIFGTEDWGTRPPSGSNIQLNWVRSDGFSGNIFGKPKLIWKWNGTGINNLGAEVDLNEVLNLEISKPIILGSDPEDSGVTKIIAPYASRSFVLATPQNWVHLLSRFGFSYIDAYTTFDDDYIDDDNVVYLFLIPDLKRKLKSSAGYWSEPIESFYLDSDEKSAIADWIDQTGRQIITSEVEIVDPIVTYYVLNVAIEILDGYDPETIRETISDKVSEYMISVKRRDKIPRSDFIAIIESIPGVDSVWVGFLSKTNEEAITKGWWTRRDVSIDRIRGIQTVTETRVYLQPGEDPLLGLDDFGDIKIGLNEFPIIRGGWSDRNGNYYESSGDYAVSSSLNIIIKSVIPNTPAKRLADVKKSGIKS